MSTPTPATVESQTAATKQYHKSVLPTLVQRIRNLPTSLLRFLRGTRGNEKLITTEKLFSLLNRPRRMARLEHQHLSQARLSHIVEVNQPLILISQIQRSGGTLLSQLFDHHPQCHAHPYELFIGYPRKMVWPVLNLQDKPDVWFRSLFEVPAWNALTGGYTKYGRGAEEDFDIHPFVFLPSLQRAIFRKCAASRTIASGRDILDCYMTSYFNAWLDNQNLHGGPKKLVTAFVPRMGMDLENLRRFFEIYPEGRLLSIIREPQSWYVSARKHKPESYGNLLEAIRLWSESTSAIVEAKLRYPSHVCVLGFEELLGNTEGTMRSVAAYLGIDFGPTLLTPTFNGLPIKADSSFKVQSYGILKDPIQRHKQALSQDEKDTIDRHARGLFEAVAAVRHRSQPSASAA